MASSGKSRHHSIYRDFVSTFILVPRGSLFVRLPLQTHNTIIEVGPSSAMKMYCVKKSYTHTVVTARQCSHCFQLSLVLLLLFHRLLLQKVYPSKSSDEIQELLVTADSQLKPEDDNIHYKSLFQEDEEGNASPFIVILRNQFSAERKQYLKQLKDKLGDNYVKPEELKAAFLSVDPVIDDKTLDRYLSRAFQVTKEQLDVTKPLTLKQIFYNLDAVNIRKTGPAAQV
ncbi:hypothetical protein GDO81_015999 [Engystomops pustulosus]|uniref:Uncharacterized protein n=1 Tax=Engystomops pustulosus TaxID=76066 RepID=A0AAV7AUR5_ENGPU|nr:hypothetical protein GDO81_015999 [Engystomops pustulosus]